MPGLREKLAGRYERHEIVGRGGMGVVYRARDQILDRTVALKVLPTDSAGDPTLIARFEREARTAGALNHRNIVAVFDIGREADTRFIAMEYVAGRNLAQLVRAEGRLTAERAVEIGAQVASALGAAHRAGIIHRDIKPANVMVDDSGAVKVLDFGIARAADGMSLTRTTVVLGSAPYLSPEVIRGGRADERSDIYSLGCLLYELLTGRPPFTGELPAAVMHQHNSALPQPPRERNSAVPAALDALVLQMLAKRPEDLPQSARELATALRTSLQTPPAALTVTTQRRTPPAAPTAPTQRLTPARRHRVWIAAIGLAILLAVALLLALPGSSARHRHGARADAAGARRPHATPPAHSPTHKSSPPSPRPASRPRSSNAPLTVPAAAGALTTLITQDLQSGQIDQHGQDLLSHLQDILNSYDQGNTPDAQHKVDDLTKHVSDLASHGDIRPAALPAINAAVDRLRTALLRSPAAQPAGEGPGGPHKEPKKKPPGH